MLYFMLDDEPKTRAQCHRSDYDSFDSKQREASRIDTFHVQDLIGVCVQWFLHNKRSKRLLKWEGSGGFIRRRIFTW